MTFQPSFCPRPDCAAHTRTPFRFHRQGSFRRAFDGRTVARFRCVTCNRTFSEQSFRLDYRLKRPDLLARFFRDRVAKVTHRQSARKHRCSRATEERHSRRLGAHCEAFHRSKLAEAAERGGLGEGLALDELENHEKARNTQPVPVPLLIERDTGFVLDARVAPQEPHGTPQPGGAGAASRNPKSRQAVLAAVESSHAAGPGPRASGVSTEEAPSDTTLLARLVGAGRVRRWASSAPTREAFDPFGPTDRAPSQRGDGESRSVSEARTAAKPSRWLAGQVAIRVCDRNYVRGRTDRQQHVTPAMALGVQARRWSVRKLLEWRILPSAVARR